MRKTLLVAKREYVETVKTKTFLIGVMMTPLMIVGIIFMTKVMEGRSEKEALPDRVVVVADRTGQLAELLRKEFDKHNEQFPDQRLVYEEFPTGQESWESAFESVRERIRDDRVKGLLLIEPEVMSEHEPAKLYTNKASDMEFPRLIREHVRAAVRARRAVDLNLSPQALRELTAPVEIAQFDVSAEGEQAVDHIAGFMTPFAFMFLMFTGVFGVSQGLLTSVIEEKSSRIMEVLLSGLSSLQLMAGKILGMACVGITLMGLWTTAGYLTARNQNLQYLLHVAYPGWLVTYYLLGFLLLSSVLAALGSAVNSLKEAQSLMSPITIVMIVPMIAWFFIMQYPNSIWVVLLSFVPPITPLVMVLRLSGAQTVPAWQLPATTAVLAAAALGTVWLASRIFRVGVLMYGKPPTPREILRWVTYR
jgi:ABC-2 type transport system permease protein